MSWQRICSVTVEKRRGGITLFISEFVDVEIRVGNTSVVGAPETTGVNELCGTVGASSLETVTVTCSLPITGRYVTLEKASGRFEFGEVIAVACT